MSLGSIIVNEPLPLSLQLWDGDTSKYPTAEVRDAGGSILFGGPINLPHVSVGLYRDLTKTLAAPQLITVTYIVYDDAGHTTESKIHQRSMNQINVVPETALTTMPVYRMGQVELIGRLFNPPVLKGILYFPILRAKIGTNNLKARLEPDSLFAKLEAEKELKAHIRCE